jgi:VCBS repeat-containing protein
VATLPSLSIGDVSHAEGNSGTTAFVFTVTLSTSSNKPVSVNYATQNDTAQASSDYQAANGTLNFKGGETSQQLTVLVNGDTASEPNETFFVNLTGPTNATLGDAQGVGTIQNDDNQSPTATPQSGLTTGEDTAKLITLAGTDPENDPLSYKIASLPSNGTLYKGDSTNASDQITGVPTTLSDNQVTYLPNANSNAPDSFTFKANDGFTDSAAATVSLNVSAVNNAPTATAQSVSTNEDTAKLITLAGADPDNNPLSFTVTALPGHGTLYQGDSTAAADRITAVPTGLTGSQVTYKPGSNYSNAGGNDVDSFQFKVNDGTLDSATAAAVSITVGAVNDAPVLANIEGTALSYTVGAAAASVSSTITVTDGDSANLASATVQITGNCASADDVLSFTTANGISGSYAAASCLMTLTGSASVANYQDALRNVKYSNTNSATSTTTRTVTFQADDGAASNHASNTQTRDITIHVNSAPVLAAIENTALAYTENDAATSVSSTLTLTDSDSTNLTGATVQITSNCTNPQDVLSFTTAGNISGSYTAASCLMTLSGTDTVANYQAALRAVKYSNTSNGPSALTRTVTFQADDGAAVNHASSTVTRDITVTPANDPPTGVANQTHNATGNVRIQVPAASGLLVGVTDPEGDTFTAQVDTATDTHVGDLTINTDGSYTYNPKPGHQGADTVKFKVCDNGTPSSACSAVHDLTLTVTGMLWFIDDSATCTTCDGRLTALFKMLGDFAAINDGTGDHPAAGDSIFLYSGTYTGGVTLLNNQKLIGQGAGASLSTISGLTPPTDSDTLPSTGGTAPALAGGVLLSNGGSNTVRGLALGNASGAALGLKVGADSFAPCLTQRRASTPPARR